MLSNEKILLSHKNSPHRPHPFFKHYQGLHRNYLVSRRQVPLGKFLPEKIVGTILSPIVCHILVALRSALCGSQHRRALIILLFRLLAEEDLRPQRLRRAHPAYPGGGCPLHNATIHDQ